VKAPARGAVYDVSGRQVARLRGGADGGLTSGAGRLVWNGRDDSGSAAARGVYLIRAEAGSLWGTAKVVYLRD
jgi:flagellar hook assembly protein FlgD